MSLLATGCVDDDSSKRVDIAPNDLGVTTIDVSRSVEINSVFELRGFTASGEQQALVRLTKGELANVGDAARYLPPSVEQASEITLAVGSYRDNIVTAEQDLFRLAPIDDASAAQFLALDEVATELAKANIFVAAAAPATEVPDYYFTTSCYAALLQTTPTVSQCCWGTGSDSTSTFIGSTWSVFVDPALHLVKREMHGTASTPCKASDGTTSCLGAACYFGPNGFARPQLSTLPNGDHNWIVTTHTWSYGGAWCDGAPTTGGPGSQYPTMTGTAPTGQGCPGGASGGSWDYF